MAEKNEAETGVSGVFETGLRPSGPSESKSLTAAESAGNAAPRAFTPPQLKELSRAEAEGKLGGLSIRRTLDRLKFWRPRTRPKVRTLEDSKDDLASGLVALYAEALALGLPMTAAGIRTVQRALEHERSR